MSFVRYTTNIQINFQKWHDNLLNDMLFTKLMASLSSLYDSANEKYPIYHSGILAFVVTVCLPLNIGLSKVPTVGVPVLFLAGFVSLFMLARNDKVGMSLLNHLRIPQGNKFVHSEQQLATAHMIQSKAESVQPTYINHDPFVMLENVVEYIMITHGDHLDSATRVQLESFHHMVHEITEEIRKQ